MSVVYNTTVKNTRLQAVIDAIDAGPSFGTLVLMTAANAVIATLTLPKPSATKSGGVLTLSGTPLSVAATLAGTNVAAKAELRDSTGTAVVTGLTVGGTAEGTNAGKDIVLAASTISLGQTVTVTAGTITHG